MYRTFKRSCRNWTEFANAPKIEVDTGLTMEEARAQCEEFNENRTERQIIKSFPHDFGTYKEVCVVYSDTVEEAIEFAFKVENESPAEWDAEARAELGLAAK